MSQYVCVRPNDPAPVAWELAVNYLPHAICKPKVCLRTAVAAAEAHNFPIDRIICTNAVVSKRRLTTLVRGRRV